MLAVLPIVGGVLLGWLASRRVAILLQLVFVAVASAAIIGSAPDHGHTAPRCGGRAGARRARCAVAARGLLDRRPPSRHGGAARDLVRVAVAGAVLETLGWLLASLLTGADAWRHDISTMSAVGGEHAWLVLVGEAGLTVAILALAALLRRRACAATTPWSATVLLVVAGLGFGVQALAREGGPLEACTARRPCSRCSRSAARRWPWRSRSGPPGRIASSRPGPFWPQCWGSCCSRVPWLRGWRAGSASAARHWCSPAGWRSPALARAAPGHRPSRKSHGGTSLPG